YPFYEKLLKAGYDKVCVHKGLFPPSVEQQFPHLLAYSDVRDVGKAAKDWPRMNFVIYHGGYRFAGGGKAEDAWTQFEKTGRIEWVTDLADVPVKSTILGETNARLYKYERRAALATDRIAALKAEYEQAGSQRSNLRYGYVVGSRG